MCCSEAGFTSKEPWESRMSPAQAVAEVLHLSGAEGNSTHTGGEFRHARHCILADDDTVCPR